MREGCTSLQSVKSKVSFWAGSGSWNTAGSVFTPLTVSGLHQNLVLSWVDLIYSSPYGASLLEAAAAANILRIAEISDRGAYALTGSAEKWVGINFSDTDKLYWFNDQGAYVQAQWDLVLAHELKHFEGQYDPNNGQGATDQEQNAPGWVADGPAVVAQNIVARETGRPEQVRVSYYAAEFSSEPIHALLVQGVSYTNGVTIKIARFGTSTGNNQDHTARQDNSADLILGFEGNDYIHGGGGNDHLYGGENNDEIFGGLGNDRLFGELGDDKLAGNVGTDLLHGGLNGAVNAGADIEADGTDTADYSVFLPTSGGLGIEICLTNSALDQTYANEIDFSKAAFVRDLARDNAVDTLVSVEKVIGTTSDDTFKVSSFDLARFAGSNRLGGVAEIDLGSETKTAARKGDVIDLSQCDTAVRVDLGSNEPYICSVLTEAKSRVVVRGAERVIGSNFDDIIRGNGKGVILEGGAGNDKLYGYSGDVLIGGAGADEFHLYTDRLNPAGTIEGGQSLYSNKALILGFDQTDKIFVNGTQYTGFVESGHLEGGYYADEVGAWVYDYVETRQDSFASEIGGSSFYFGTTANWYSYDLASSAGAALNGCLNLTMNGGSSSFLKIQVAGFDPTEGGINFLMASNYVDPPDYGAYTQHVGYSNGYNISNPAVYPSNPNATWEEINVLPFNLQNWMPALPTDLANYSGYVGMLG